MTKTKQEPKNENLSLPKAPKVCAKCEDGTHIMHIINELGDLIVTEFFKDNNKRYLKFSGLVKDELWLEDLMRIISWEYIYLDEKNKKSILEFIQIMDE